MCCLPSQCSRLEVDVHGAARCLRWCLLLSLLVVHMQFSNWSNSSGMPEITILVPAGHLEVGKALVAAMYDKLPDDLSQQQLLQLLLLSDSYKIDGVTEAVLSRFSSFSVEQLEWDVVLAIEQFPDAGSQFQSLKSAAHTRMLQLLGDLEVVWGLEHPDQRKRLQHIFRPTIAPLMATRADTALKARYGNSLDRFLPSRVQELRDAALAAQSAAVVAAANPTPPHELLLQLPFEQLVGLLQSEELKVMSENSVHYTIARWLQQHPDNTGEQLQRLAGLVHLCKCTPNYLINVVCKEGDWLMQHFSASQLAHAVAACIAERHSNVRKALSWDYDIAGCYVSQRPASALAQLQLSCHIPLARLQETCQGALGRDNTTYHHPEKFQWQGTEFSLEINFALEPGALDGPVSDDGTPLGAGYVNAMSVGYHATGGAGFGSQITVSKAPGQARQSVAYVQQKFEYLTSLYDQRAFIMIDSMWHGDEPVEAHVVMQHTAANWDELQQKLRDLGLVYGDGCLHVTAVLRYLC